MVKISSIIAIIVILTSSLLLSVYLRFELPNTTSNVNIPTLEGKVSVTQDQYGFYHIVADSEANGLKAEGYLMARDRLWQMDFYRREAKGELAQIFYQYDHSVLDTDYSLRAMGFYRIAQRDWSSFSNETQAFYQAFTDGVNLFINRNKNKLPIEFGILNYAPSDWTPIDSIAILKLMAFGLNTHGGGEPIVGQALQFMNQTKLTELIRMVFNNNNVTMVHPVAYPVVTVKAPKNETTTNTTNTTTTSLPFRPPPKNVSSSDTQSSILNFITSQFSFIDNMESNNWVVSGSKTATGKPMLANDPHLPLETPSRWWFVDLEIQGSGGFHVTGVTLPGIPGVVLGRNDYVMWGFTNTEIDYLDTYVETFNNNYTQYLYNGTWLNTTIKDEKFYTSQISFVQKDIYITNGYNNFTHGARPVVPMFGINTTVRWTGQDSSSAAEALVLMQKSKSIQDFTNALQLFNAPGQNVVFADSNNIGLYVTGDIPIRNAGNGLAPHNGSVSTYEWKAMVPRTKAYHFEDPPSGFIATANNRVIPLNYSYNNTPIFLGWAFDSPYRIDRITQLLNVKTPITYSYMEGMQNDVYSLFAQAVVPKILIPTSDPAIQAMETALENWNYFYNVNSTQGPILALFTQYFLNFTYGDDLKDNLLNQIPIQGKLTENTLDLPQNSTWFNNIVTGKNQTKNEVIIEAYNAVKDYYQSHKLNINTFTWGDLHKVQFTHVLGSKVDFLNAGGLQPSPGSPYTINVGTYNENFIQTDGASMRQIMGMDANKTFLVVIPPGESGIVGQTHYADQISRWLEGNYCIVIVEK